MQRYAGFGRVTPIPYTTVRGMSDNVVPTLAMNGTVPNSADTLWVNGVKVGQPVAASQAVAQRCVAQRGRGRGTAQGAVLLGCLRAVSR